MVETQEYKGLWWLPSDEDEQLSGTLTITKGEAALELLGHFGYEILYETETEKVGSGSLAEQARILGLTSDGKRVTLEGHISAPYTEHFPGIPVATYTRSVTLIGRHFAEGEEIEFDEIAIRASDLNTWTQVFALQGKYGRRKGHQAFTKGIIGFEVPDDIDIPLSRGETASIRFVVHSDGLFLPSDRASLTQNATLHVRFPRRVSLQRVFERVGQIRNFLSLAIGRPVSISSVTGFQDDYLRERPKVPMPIELLWAVPHNPDPPEKPRAAREMFFTLPEASPDISRVLRKWFAKQARLRPVFNLFFGTRYHPDLYLDVRFLLFAQAVETYGYLRRSKAVERSFADQVRDVLSGCETVSRKIVGDEAAFVAHLKVSRDYYTHYNPKKEKLAAAEAALYLLTIQLQALIEMSLLRELGFTTKAIDGILTRVGRYREIAHFKAVVAGEQ